MKQKRDWKIIAGFIKIVPKLDEVTQSNTLDYGDIILSRFQIPITDAKKLVDSTVKDKILIHPDLGEIEIEGRLSAYSNKLEISYYKKESQYQWGYTSSRWPYYYFEIGLNRNGQPETKGLVKKGLPLYPTWYDGVHHFLEIGRKNTDVQSVSHIPFIIPDPRARIQQIHMQGKKVSVVVEPGELPIEKLMIKMFAASEEETIPDIEMPFRDLEISYEYPFDPAVLNVYILDMNGDPIDFRDINLTWAGGGRIPVGVIIERSEESILDYLEAGEGQHIEYKLSLDEKGSRTKFPKVISSFANASGGFLFLGVDDEGVPQMSIDKSEMDRISQILSEHVNPPIQMQMQQIVVYGINVLAVSVAEGEDKPYVVKDKGTFIRYNATTRQANRDEILLLSSR